MLAEKLESHNEILWWILGIEHVLEILDQHNSIHKNTRIWGSWSNIEGKQGTLQGKTLIPTWIEHIGDFRPT